MKALLVAPTSRATLTTSSSSDTTVDSTRKVAEELAGNEGDK